MWLSTELEKITVREAFEETGRGYTSVLFGDFASEGTSVPSMTLTTLRKKKTATPDILGVKAADSTHAMWENISSHSEALHFLGCTPAVFCGGSVLQASASEPDGQAEPCAQQPPDCEVAREIVLTGRPPVQQIRHGHGYAKIVSRVCFPAAKTSGA